MFNMKKQIVALSDRLAEWQARASALESENDRMRADIAILREALHTDDPLEIVARVRSLENGKPVAAR